MSTPRWPRPAASWSSTCAASALPPRSSPRRSSPIAIIAEELFMRRYFTQDHEWIEVEGDTGTVGITDYAQGQLGDITFVELPGVGQAVAKGDSVSVVDSVKAASDVYTPVSGEVTDVNGALD